MAPRQKSTQPKIIPPTKTPTINQAKPKPQKRIIRSVMTRPEQARVAHLRHASNGAFSYKTAPKRPVSNNSNNSTIINKYEQLLSGWINSHRLNKVITLPAGANGRVVVRLRINRRGYVIFKTIEKSSGVPELDQAAIDSVTRASPVPAVPAEYTGGAQLEFLIPINFVIN